MDSESRDELLVSTLDKYVEQLQQGSPADREALLSLFPDLKGMVHCLEVLNSLAPLGVPENQDQQEISSKSQHDPPSTLVAPVQPHAAAEATLVTLPANEASGPVFPMGSVVEVSERNKVDFGQYELLDELGRGGMGVVYKARQKSLDRLVAIKMILASHLASPDQVRRFHDEARAAAGLNHPHIISIYEVGQHQGQHFIAMEFVPGRTLAERLQQGRMDVDAAVRLLVDVAWAVDHLHQHGVVHRDLKPSNILIDDQERPYVTDFGLAKLYNGDSARTATGVIAGTPSYMAPEQASGKAGQIGPASDIYSLGAILYELIASRPPFREDNPLDTLIQVLEREPAPPRQLNPLVPRSLELICLKCLEKSPANRYASAAELADELERFLKGEELRVRPPRGLHRMLRWARRQPALSSRLGALTAFYLIELFNYYVVRSIEPSFHYWVSGVVVAWALASWVCQQLLNRPNWSIPVIFGWAAVDAVCLLAALRRGDGVASPMVLGYPLLIVASGLWFRVRLVWFMTTLSIVSYLLMAADYYQLPAALRPEFDSQPDRHIYFVVALVILGTVTGHQVARTRALSRYYESGAKRQP